MNWRCPTTSPFCSHRIWPFRIRCITRTPQSLRAALPDEILCIAGLRVGALVAAADVVIRWRELREPWQVNVLAEEAALAAIADTDHARRTLAFVAAERAWLLSQMVSLPAIQPLPSTANYLFVRLDYSAGQKDNSPWTVRVEWREATPFAKAARLAPPRRTQACGGRGPCRQWPRARLPLPERSPAMAPAARASVLQRPLRRRARRLATRQCIEFRQGAQHAKIGACE